jgi:hypothetical protein
MGKISVETDKTFRVSLPGKSADSTDMLDFAVHSGFDYPKMEEDLVGVVNYTVPASVSATTYNILTVTHNLGYIPCSVCFMEDVDNITPTEFATLPFYEGLTLNRFEAYATSTQFKIDVVFVDDGWGFYTDWEGKEFNFKYSVFIND